MSIDRAFARCALAYRTSITGTAHADHPFDCVERAAREKGDPDTTYGIVSGFSQASRAGLRYVDALAAEASRARSGDQALGRVQLQALAAGRAEYRRALCGMYGSLTGGTIDRSNAGICTARDIDAQIDDLLSLLKEDGVIANGR